MARTMSRIHDVPLTIARMNWSYGSGGSGGLPARLVQLVADGKPVPVCPDWEFVGCPIHEDDMANHIDGLFDAASVGATITNWAGDDAVSVEQLVPWIANQMGTGYTFEEWTDITAYTRATDNTRSIAMVGECRVKWPDGFRRLISERHPGRLVTPMSTPGSPA